MLPSTLDDVGNVAQLSTLFGSIHKKIVYFMNERPLFCSSDKKNTWMMDLNENLYFGEQDRNHKGIMVLGHWEKCY